MDILDFSTKDKRNSAVSNFKTLVEQPGWKLFEAIIRANIEVVRYQILHGVDNETKEDIDRKRDKLRVYEECLGTPDFMVNKLSDTEVVHTRYDPYDTLGDVNKRKLDNIL